MQTGDGDKGVVKKERPERPGIYHCPWMLRNFVVPEQDPGTGLCLLKDLADVFSPMVYHGRMGRDAVWVKNNIEWFCKRMDIKPGAFPKVWPIVQAYDEPRVISPDEFGEVLGYGSGSGATGIMMFTSYAVAESSAKTETLQKVYSGLISRE